MLLDFSTYSDGWLASINQRKSSLAAQHPNYGHPKSNAYMNPNYRASNKYIRPGLTPNIQALPSQSVSTSSASSNVKEVVLNGVAFESSGRSLVRKDRKSQSHNSCDSPLGPAPHQYNHRHVFLVPKPASSGGSTYLPQRPAVPQHPLFPPKRPRQPNGNRMYKPKTSRGRNMTLTNYRRPYQSVAPRIWHLYSRLMNYITRSRRGANKSRKYSNKPCPRFTTTGTHARHIRLSGV